MQYLYLAGFMLVVWLVSNLWQWAESKQSYNEPFNWRVFLGPIIYLNWLKRRYEK